MWKKLKVLHTCCSSSIESLLVLLSASTPLVDCHAGITQQMLNIVPWLPCVFTTFPKHLILLVQALSLRSQNVSYIVHHFLSVSFLLHILCQLLGACYTLRYTWYRIGVLVLVSRHMCSSNYDTLYQLKTTTCNEYISVMHAQLHSSLILWTLNA